MSPKKEPRKAGNTAAAARKRSAFTAEERKAMKEHVEEFKAESRGSRAPTKEDGERVVLGKIAAMPAADRAIGERLHAIIMASAPELVPRLWYGMPAYSKDGNVVCFYQNAGKFKARYGTLGFSDKARLDDGTMWPTSFALTRLTAADEARISDLVKKAAG
jgi:uncharacterized protein YdhG (YjbR/CyaY superfamily)